MKPYGNAIEILVYETERFIDGGPHVGVKRNYCLKMAKGDYVNGVDSDDSIAPDYVSSIMESMKTSPDCICFECKYTNAETGVKSHVYFGRANLNLNIDDKGRRERMVNHLNPVKRELALKAGFPESSFSEDTEYAMRLRNRTLLRTEVIIPKILYYYNFSSKTSDTWHLSPANNLVKRVSEPLVKMDVIMVSDGRQPVMANMTQQAIDSIEGLNANVIVVEKAERGYSKADSIPQPEPFNYNACLNKGSKYGNAALICFTNNDVIFPSSFVGKIAALQHATKADVISVKTQHGFIHPTIISGFCFVITREAYHKLGKLDESFEFWCADNVTSEQIKEKGLNELKSDIQVHHLTSVSLNKLEPQKKENYTRGCVKKFNKQFNQNVLGMGI